MKASMAQATFLLNKTLNFLFFKNLKLQNKKTKTDDKIKESEVNFIRTDKAKKNPKRM